MATLGLVPIVLPCGLLLRLLTAQVAPGLDLSTCAEQYKSSAQWMQNRAPGGPRPCVHAGAHHHADDNRAGRSRPVPVTRAGRPLGGTLRCAHLAHATLLTRPLKFIY